MATNCTNKMDQKGIWQKGGKHIKLRMDKGKGGKTPV
jgi:hypothetical protein